MRNLCLMMAVTHSFEQQCETLPDNWKCSIGSDRRSLCSSLCRSTSSHTKFDKKRCVCHQHSGCKWMNRGNVCQQEITSFNKKRPDRKNLSNHRTLSSPMSSVISTLSEKAEKLKELFAEVANFNLHDSVINFYFASNEPNNH